GIAGAERTCAIDEIEGIQRSAARGDGAVDPQGVIAACGFDPIVQLRLEERAEGSEIALLERDAGRHRMAAALDEQAFDHRFPDGATEVHTRDRPPRTGTEFTGFECDRE